MRAECWGLAGRSRRSGQAPPPSGLPSTQIGPAPVIAEFSAASPCRGVTSHIAGHVVTLCDFYHGVPHILMTAVAGNKVLPVTLQIRAGANPVIGVVDLFEHHLRLFGANERNWTTRPIG